MWQSSRLTVLLPAWLAAAVFGLTVDTPRLSAQVTYTVTRAENFRRSASVSAPILAKVSAGTRLTGSQAGGEWTPVTLSGWVWAQSLSSIDQGEFDLRVNARGGENLRSGPSGKIVARLSEGSLFTRVDRNGRWIQVRRSGWMWSESLRPADKIVTSPRALQGASSGSQPSLERAMVAHSSPLLAVPDGDATATLGEDTPVRILTRSGEWVRVQIEGWVRESDLKPQAAGVLVGVSGAEVRAAAAEYEGKVLQWTLQYLAVQEADALRVEIPAGEHYMLARGPLPEAGFVYVILSAAQREKVEQLVPLSQLVVLGRVKTARSRYLGNPVIELLDFSLRKH
ncbi:MAG: hypothetical protein ACE5HT_05905 [Gemmatimonadales bacterium]